MKDDNDKKEKEKMDKMGEITKELSRLSMEMSEMETEADSPEYFKGRYEELSKQFADLLMKRHKMALELDIKPTYSPMTDEFATISTSGMRLNEEEEMEAEVEETEGLDFDNPPGGIYRFPSNYWIVGPERERAKKDDPQMKELEKHVMDGGEGLILGKSDGRINVLIVFRDINPFTGLDRGVGWGREGHSGGGTRGGLDLSPKDALRYLKEGAKLIQDEDAKEAFMSVTEEDLEKMPDDTYFVAKTDKKGPKEERPKTTGRGGRGPSRRTDINRDEPYGGDVVARRAAAQAKKYGTGRRRRFEEGKLTKSKLLQIIREEMEAELEEKSSGPLHEAYYAMRDFVDNLRDEALQEEGIDLADDLFDAIHDVMPFPDQD